MVNTEELKLKITNITDLINDILAETEKTDYNDFSHDEQLKERVFSQLQEIGQSSYEISQDLKVIYDNKNIFDNLSNFRNARYNQVAEMELNNVWNLIQNNFKEIEEELLKDQNPNDDEFVY